MTQKPKMFCRSAALLAPLLLAACTIPGVGEPIDREGLWRATGVNEANLRAMVADPAHLSRGVEAQTPARGEPAALAAQRLGFPSTPAAGVATSPGLPALPITGTRQRGGT